MKNHNTTFIIVMSIGLLLALYGFINKGEAGNPLTTDWVSIGISMAQIGGLFMLIANGTFILSKYFKYLQFAFALHLIGLLFMMMHWPYTRIILSITVSSILISYVLSFLAKPIKKSLDYAKLLWVITYFSYVLLKSFHWINSEYKAVSTICLWTAIGLYFLQEAQLANTQKD